MRINTDGKHEYRLDVLRRVMQQTGEGTKSGAFDFSTESTLRMLQNLERVAQNSDMTEELAAVLSTPTVDLSYQAQADLDISPSQRARQTDG